MEQTAEQKRYYFETTLLPNQIKNKDIPSLTSKLPDGSTRVLFRRAGEIFEMHRIVHAILEKHDLLNGIIEFLATQTEHETIIFTDDDEILMGASLKKPKA